VNNGFDTLKVNGSTNVHMLIIDEMWKKSLIHSNMNARFLIVTRVLINNGFNMLKVDGSIHVPC
jgi:hypothetical protein